MTLIRLEVPAEHGIFIWAGQCDMGVDREVSACQAASASFSIRLSLRTLDYIERPYLGER